MKMREFAEQSKAWPFEEARKVLARIEKSGAQEAIFETVARPIIVTSRSDATFQKSKFIYVLLKIQILRNGQNSISAVVSPENRSKLE